MYCVLCKSLPALPALLLFSRKETFKNQTEFAGVKVNAIPGFQGDRVNYLYHFEVLLFQVYESSAPPSSPEKLGSFELFAALV